MKKAFYFNIFLLVGLNLLIKPFYIFGIDRVVQNTVEVGSYGLFFTLFNFAYIFQIINDFGIQNFNNRSISTDQAQLKYLFPNLIISKLLLGIVFLFLVFIFAWISGYQGNILTLLFYVSLVHILNSFVLFLRSNVSALGFYIHDSLFSIIDKSLMILICGYLLLRSDPGSFKISWFVLAQIFSLLITAIAILIYLWPNLRNLKITFKISDIKNVLVKSLPFALVVFLMSVYTRIDAFMLERMLTNGRIEVDAYAGAFRILDALNIIAFLFAGLLLPMFSKVLTEKIALRKLIHQGFLLLWAISVLFSIAITCYAQEWSFLLYVHATEKWGQILSILALCFIPMSAIYIYGTLLTANGKLRKLNYLLFFGALLNIVLNFILIPKMQAIGAAISTLITQSCMFIGHIFLSKKQLSLSWSRLLIRKSLIYALTILVLAYFLLYLIDIRWIFKFIILILSGGITALILRLIDINEFANMLRSKQK